MNGKKKTKKMESKGHPQIRLRFFVDLGFNVHRVVWIVGIKLYINIYIYVYTHICICIYIITVKQSN